MATRPLKRNGKWIMSKRQAEITIYTYMYRTTLPYYVRVTRYAMGICAVYVEYCPGRLRPVTIHSSASKNLLSAKHVARDAIRRHRKMLAIKHAVRKPKNQPSRRVTLGGGRKKTRV